MLLSLRGTGLMMEPKKRHFNRRLDSGVVGNLLYGIYRVQKRSVRRVVLKLCWLLLGSHHQFYSVTLRRIFRDFHGVDIGMYSHGGCFKPEQVASGTTIGRYCSIAQTATAHNTNHPTNTPSSHAFFFNPELDYVQEKKISSTTLTIGNDVWIGHNAVILSSCASIGDGAVVAAGAVVNKNVPPYAIVVGNPARVARFRFSEEIRTQLVQSAWWDQDIDVLRDRFDWFTTPMEGSKIR